MPSPRRRPEEPVSGTVGTGTLARTVVRREVMGKELGNVVRTRRGGSMLPVFQKPCDESEAEDAES
jgi:hypothetical protein